LVAYNLAHVVAEEQKGISSFDMQQSSVVSGFMKGQNFLIESAHAGWRCLLVYLVHICLIEMGRNSLSIEAWLTHVI
jgi:hypothetical protein